MEPGAQIAVRNSLADSFRSMHISADTANIAISDISNKTASLSVEQEKQRKVDFNTHVRNAKQFEEAGDLIHALEFYGMAAGLFEARADLEKKMKKLQVRFMNIG